MSEFREADVIRCVHGRYRIDPCIGCGRRYEAGDLVGPCVVDDVFATDEGPHEGDRVRLTYGDGSTVEGTWREVVELDDGSFNTHTRGQVRRDVIRTADSEKKGAA